jgi:PST family polysaccharide transporter
MDAHWLKYLPRVLRTRVSGRHEAQAIIGNSIWLVFDKLLRMAIGLPIGIWMARYLGPDLFGQLSYALAFVAMFGAIASAGLDGIVVRELVRRPERANEILGTAFALKLLTGTVAFALSVVVVRFTGSQNPATFWLVAVIAAGLVLQSFDVIDFWFQSQVQSRFIVRARMIAFLASSIVRVVLILTHGSLISFALVSLAEIAISAGFMLVAYRGRHLLLSSFQFRSERARQLLRESWPLLLSGIAVMLYMRIDMVMLQEMTDVHQVGIYAAATKLSEVWYALPIILSSSVFPAILRSHGRDLSAYLHGLRRLYFLFTWLAIGISLPLSLGADWIITTLYGNAYAPAGPVLAVHLWASVAVFLGIASSQHLLAENLQVISFYRTAIGLICNILLNLALIPRYQALGAALATVVSYFVATFSLVLFRRTRSHAAYMLLAPFVKK